MYVFVVKHIACMALTERGNKYPFKITKYLKMHHTKYFNYFKAL